jgi:hypothetical protein
MALGTVGVAGALDQAMASRHDRIEAAEQRHEGRSCRQHGDRSVRLAEDEGERQNEDLFVEIVADMHDPVAPVFGVASMISERTMQAARSRASARSLTASPDRSIRTSREFEQWKYTWAMSASCAWAKLLL